MNNISRSLFYILRINKIKLSNFIALILFIQLLVPLKTSAQTLKEIHAEVELQTIGTTHGVVPFWMRSNQFGSIPLSGFSQSFIGRAHKDYELKNIDSSSQKRSLIDWGFGFEARGNVGSNINGQIIEAYGKGRIGIFQLKVGRSRDVMGLNGDTILSSGNFAVSGNALGVPKVEISIPEFWRVPALGGLFSIKGNFTHGWVGQARILDSIGSLPPSKEVFYINDNTPKTYLHQKSLYVKLGKEDWKLALIGGFSHQVYWGNEQEAYGSNFKLSPAKTFLYVAIGKAYGTKGVPTSKIGNQLGSIDLGLEYKFNNIHMLIYRQFFYDVGALSKLANVADGLTGITFTNVKYETGKSGFKWKKILIESFYSKNQAGYPWSKPTKSGDEDYYNNFYYKEGWSYKSVGLGNPLITRRDDAKPGQAQREIEYFLNNRVVALHIGLIGNYNNWDFTTKATYSNNYGTFGTSIYGSSTGSIRSENTTNIFKKVNEFSFYLKASTEMNKGLRLGFITAADSGGLLKTSFGFSAFLIKAL